MIPRMVTAVDMARAAGIDPKRFRSALRMANFSWHRHSMSWTAAEGSAEHRDMLSVLASITKGGERPTISSRPPRNGKPSRAGSDEHYIIDLCDGILGANALRGHRFGFLLGDPDRSGIRRSLPVDAYYPDHQLVIEYCERQHTECTPFFDRRLTLSGISRGEQRELYDQRRRDVLPEHAITLIEFHHSDFACDSARRLRRGLTDEQIIQARLTAEGFL